VRAFIRATLSNVGLGMNLADTHSRRLSAYEAPHRSLLGYTGQADWIASSHPETGYVAQCETWREARQEVSGCGVTSDLGGRRRNAVFILI